MRSCNEVLEELKRIDAKLTLIEKANDEALKGDITESENFYRHHNTIKLLIQSAVLFWVLGQDDAATKTYARVRDIVENKVKWEGVREAQKESLLDTIEFLSKKSSMKR